MNIIACDSGDDLSNEMSIYMGDVIKLVEVCEYRKYVRIRFAHKIALFRGHAHVEISR